MAKDLHPLALRYAREITEYIATLERERGQRFWDGLEPGELLGSLIHQVGELAGSMARRCCGQAEALGFIGALSAMLADEGMAFMDKAKAVGAMRPVAEEGPNAL